MDCSNEYVKERKEEQPEIKKLHWFKI